MSSHTDDGCVGSTPAILEAGTVLRAHRGGRGNKALQAQTEYNCNWTCMAYNNGRQRNGAKQLESNGGSGRNGGNNNKTQRPPGEELDDENRHFPYQ